MKKIKKVLQKQVISDKIIFAFEIQGGVSYMAKCDVCDKSVSFGIKVSHSHRRSNKMWKSNIRTVKAIVNGSPKTVHICSRCLRSGKVVRAI